MTTAPSALERIEALEKKVQELEANQAGTHQFAEQALNNSAMLGQAQTAFGKTLTALISILTEKGAVEGDIILAKIREFDDRTEKERVQQMVTGGILVSTEVSSTETIVIISQIFIPEESPEKSVQLSGYRTVELFSPEIPPQLRDQFLNKKIGETITTMAPGGGKILNTVIEIYGIASEKTGGEGETNAEVQTK